jgi:hypothetical protein
MGRGLVFRNRPERIWPQASRFGKDSGHSARILLERSHPAWGLAA